MQEGLTLVIVINGIINMMQGMCSLRTYIRG